MSREFQPKSVDMVNLKAVPREAVWQKYKNSKGQIDYKIKDGVNVYGKVTKGYSSTISSFNRKNKNHKFLNDFHSLSKKNKNEITNLFMNKNKRVVYLIKTK